jgi:4,5-dihydroxyphthalate decarboxylase
METLDAGLPSDNLPNKDRGAETLPSIKIAVADYDRTRPILDGHVRPAGVALTATARKISEICRTPIYEEYDAAEMSFSWYVAARARGEPVIALPIFLLRMPVLAYVYVRSDSSATSPRDLVGKRIGSRGYRQTLNLWLRGLFEEHYGVSPRQVTWALSETSEGAGYQIPDDIPVDVSDPSSAATKLKNGQVEAMFCTSIPEPVRNREKWIRRLFPDAHAETRRLAEETGITPITHVLAMNKRLADREPWIAARLYHAFLDAQRQCDRTYQDPKKMSLFDAEDVIERQRAAYGATPYSHGVEGNRKTIETFASYAHQQGYTERQMSVDELFISQTVLA